MSQWLFVGMVCPGFHRTPEQCWAGKAGSALHMSLWHSGTNYPVHNKAPFPYSFLSAKIPNFTTYVKPELSDFSVCSSTKNWRKGHATSLLTSVDLPLSHDCRWHLQTGFLQFDAKEIFFLRRKKSGSVCCICSDWYLFSWSYKRDFIGLSQEVDLLNWLTLIRKRFVRIFILVNITHPTCLMEK